MAKYCVMTSRHHNIIVFGAQEQHCREKKILRPWLFVAFIANYFVVCICLSTYPLLNGKFNSEHTFCLDSSLEIHAVFTPRFTT